MNVSKQIEKVYEDNDMPGLTKLIALVQRSSPSIPKDRITNWYNRQLDVQLMSKRQTAKHTGHIAALFPNDVWSVDIFDMTKYAEHNRGFKYIFAAVDTFTRKAFVEPMMFKDTDTAGGALQSIIMEHKVKPHAILADNDAAYTGKTFSEVLDKNDIVLDMNLVGDHEALGIIDNFAKRLKLEFNKKGIRKMKREGQSVEIKKVVWINRLQKVVGDYSSKTKLSALGKTDIGLGRTPNDATKEKNFEPIHELNLAKTEANKTVSDLSPGDRVRINIETRFSKGTDPKWSEETYVVKEAVGNKVILEDGTRHLRYNLLKIPEEERRRVTGKSKPE